MRIFDPSKGGMGKELKIARIKLIKAVNFKTESRINGTSNGLKIFNKTAAKTAMAKLLKIPAAETQSSPGFISLKLKGLTGTGLAQPKSIGEPEKIKRAGKRMVPIGSMWGMGFRVNLPAASAVLSPNLRAIYPCMTSWIITENKRITIDKAKNAGSMFKLYEIKLIKYRMGIIIRTYTHAGSYPAKLNEARCFGL